MSTIIVIGGGAAGMMAAYAAAAEGHAVTLLEKNDRLGRKLYITGKGRCNVTNDTGTDGLLASVNTNARFLYGAFNAFSSTDLMHFFEESGVPLKTERGRRVFPESDRSADIVRALESRMRESGVRVMLRQEVRTVEALNDTVCGVRTPQGLIAADAVIVATGGLSYPSTGSTGDGYRFARKLGHTVTPLYPSLVPLKAPESWIPALEGLSLRNVRVSVLMEGVKKPLYTEMGEMLFTHDGVSGPVVLSASRFITDKPRPCAERRVTLSIDLKPALSREMLDERIRRDFQAAINKDFANALDGLLPKKLIPVVVSLSGIPPERKVHDVTREERARLGVLLKSLTITPSAAGYDEAVITMGGVNVREIDPKTMMSKKIKGLYFVGEVLDVDAMTGGYNLQIAFSTGYLAGKSVDCQ